LLLRELNDRPLLGVIRLGFVEVVLRLKFKLLVLPELSLQIASIHNSKHLPRLDQITLVDIQLRDAAGEFGGNIDRVGFKPAIARSKTRRQGRLRMKPPPVSSAHRERD
jgi:hypothetical protein